jgi:WD40 repeat protein
MPTPRSSIRCETSRATAWLVGFTTFLGSGSLVAEEIRVSVGHLSPVASVAFSPDSRTVASASCDKTVKLWDVANGKHIRTFSGHKDFVWSVAFSP